MKSNLIAAFKKQFIKKSEPVSKELIKAVYPLSVLKEGATFYLISIGNEFGNLTEQIRYLLERLIPDKNTTKIFVTIYGTQDEFLNPETVSWGSFVWFADEPAHFIHYDENPKIKPRISVG